MLTEKNGQQKKKRRKRQKKGEGGKIEDQSRHRFNQTVLSTSLCLECQLNPLSPLFFFALFFVFVFVFNDQHFRKQRQLLKVVPHVSLGLLGLCLFEPIRPF